MANSHFGPRFLLQVPCENAFFRPPFLAFPCISSYFPRISSLFPRIFLSVPRISSYFPRISSYFLVFSSVFCHSPRLLGRVTASVHILPSKKASFCLAWVLEASKGFSWEGWDVSRSYFLRISWHFLAFPRIFLVFSSYFHVFSSYFLGILPGPRVLQQVPCEILLFFPAETAFGRYSH